MDINLPALDGIDATAKIIEHKPDTNILALSMHDESYQIKKMIKAGARGYILKNVGPEELNKAIQSVADGDKYYSNEVSQILLEPHQDEVIYDKKAPKPYIGELTKREIEVLLLITDEFTNQEIADQLFLSKRTVDAHRQHLLQKTHSKNTAGLIKYAVKNNII